MLRHAPSLSPVFFLRLNKPENKPERVDLSIQFFWARDKTTGWGEGWRSEVKARTCTWKKNCFLILMIGSSWIRICKFTWNLHVNMNKNGNDNKNWETGKTIFFFCGCWCSYWKTLPRLRKNSFCSPDFDKLKLLLMCRRLLSAPAVFFCVKFNDGEKMVKR